MTTAALAADIPGSGDVEALRRQLAAQQQQIEELRQMLAAQQKLLERLAAPQAPAGETRPAATATPSAAIAGARSQPAQSLAQSANPPAGEAKPQASPLSFRIGNADFTPGGFMDLTSILRSTNVGSGIGTSFGGIPFDNVAAGKQSESRFSAQNSRLTLKVSTNHGASAVTGYLEADFLGNAPANLNVSSNGNTMRMRVYWLDVQRGNWEVLGGQSWSMLTPGRKGISPVPSDLFYTQNVDTNYQVGLVWTRAPQFRVVYHSKSGWHFGFALENPQQYVGGGVVLPSFATSQFDNGSTAGVPNLHPDIQAKLAYDAKFGGGRTFHIEAAGVLRGFQNVGPSPALAHNTTEGGAGSLNMNLEVVKNFRLIATSFYGAGGGRYIFGLGPDAIVRPDGSISLIHSGAGIGGVEYQVNTKALLYGYYGVAYFGRDYSPSGSTYVGYGFPGASSSANRTIQEWTVGYTHTFWKNPHYGAIQLLSQYSYLERAPWSVPASGPEQAHAHMLYNNLRFVLP
ncbi:MAG: hypothetical protein ABSD56_11785 [Bryobacteraceae bacterium]